MRKGDCSICSNLADFTMAASFLLLQKEENEKRELFHLLHFSRFYYGCQFLLTSERGKRRKEDCSIYSNLADFTMAASFFLLQREEK